MFMYRLLLILLLAPLSAHSVAETKIILLGGGASPDSSELSIEKNVGWISNILKRNGVKDFDVLFASGSNGNSDVKEINPEKPDLEKWLPLARIFSSKSSLLTTYRKNTVANLAKENTRDNVIELIERRLREAKSDDDLLIIYLGHGGYSSRDTNNNYLRLWGDTKLSAIDLINIFNKQPKETTVRFIFPQCFSGAFVRTVHDSPENFTLDNINTKRCGFVTVPDNRKSEGCTVEDDETKYRDFTTFFFAAIDGKTRLGKPLEWNPDKNNDGIVDFREAYFYANIEAYARGVPRTTSEYFLELWEPWYIRWLPFYLPDVDNEYKAAAIHIADKLGIAPDPEQIGFMDAVLASRKIAETAYREAKKRLGEHKKEEKVLRKKLKNQITMRWPDVKNAYSDNYLVFVDRDLSASSQWLISQSSYDELVEHQDRIEMLEEELLSTERDVGMNMRLRRAIHLAKLTDALNRFGSRNNVTHYNELLECESWDGITK